MQGRARRVKELIISSNKLGVFVGGEVTSRNRRIWRKERECKVEKTVQSKN